jgi:hypothetical protein
LITWVFFLVVIFLVDHQRSDQFRGSREVGHCSINRDQYSQICCLSLFALQVSNEECLRRSVMKKSFDATLNNHEYIPLFSAVSSGRPVQQTPKPPNHNWKRRISLTRNRDHRNPSQACFGFLEPLTAEHGHSDSAHHGDAVPRLQTRFRAFDH